MPCSPEVPVNDLPPLAPEGVDLIGGQLAVWKQSLRSDHHLDPLVRMVVAHHRVEAIHPSHQGNARIGRVISIVMPIQAGLLVDPSLSLSRAIIARTKDDHRLPYRADRPAAIDRFARKRAESRVSHGRTARP